MCLQGRNGEADMVNGRVDTKGEGWVNWENGTGTHTQPHGNGGRLESCRAAQGAQPGAP